jgi:hypothetical protein
MKFIKNFFKRLACPHDTWTPVAHPFWGRHSQWDVVNMPIRAYQCDKCGKVIYRRDPPVNKI